jgi:hypothetical protein
VEVGRLKGQGREKEEKGKRKGSEREGKGKGKGKERESEGNYSKFCSFSSFQNGFEIPKQPKQIERGDYILSEKIPNQNRNCQCFGLFRFEPKEKKLRFAGHPTSEDGWLRSAGRAGHYPVRSELCRRHAFSSPRKIVGSGIYGTSFSDWGEEDETMASSG